MIFVTVNHDFIAQNVQKERTIMRDEVNVNNVKNATILIRKLFPQKKTFSFSKPSIIVFEKLVNALEDESVEDFDNKVIRILG